MSGSGASGNKRRRFYCNPLPQTGEVEIGDSEAHHLLHVLRIKVGQSIELFDGQNHQATADVIQIGKRTVIARIDRWDPVSSELPTRLKIAVAMPKGDRQQFMVEKLVELGCTELWPIQYQRSNAKMEAKTIDKWRRYVLEASKQCGRNQLMEIRSPTTSRDLFSETSGSVAWIADPTAVLPLTPSVSNAETLIAIGPEGGFTPEEIQWAESSKWQRGHLGPRILRLETAAMVVAARSGLSADGFETR